MAGELTTLYLFKQYAGITTSTDDKLIERLITDVSQLIAEACDRTFTETTYRVWLDGTGEYRMLLPEWPVRNIYRVTAQTNDLMDVKFTGGTHADVSFDGTNVTLHSLDTSGDETTSTLAISSYKTATTLVDAINAVSGWSATLRSGEGNEPTSLMKPVYGAWALDPDDMEFEGPDDGLTVELAYDTDRMIEGAFFPCGRSNIFAWYKAGYTLPVDDSQHSKLDTMGNLPGGLIKAANQVIKDVKDGADEDMTLKSEKEGDWSASRSDIFSAIERQWKDLDMYSRKADA